ncbi:hypothetical protein C8R44DRAFT_797452 [Mycena epipterygia]|nr:hypothetical protein C8R44DRAFT_797452 [Mycena epipterygia]
MAELAPGLEAPTLTPGSGFTARHESSHREGMMDTRRSTTDFMQNPESGDVTQEEQMEFLNTRDEAIRRQNEYYGRIESYKEASWVNPLNKLKKKKEVRKAKRLTRQSNHSLRTLNESMYSGSDTSSISAESGSPPGSNLAVDDLQDWRNGVDEASDLEVAETTHSAARSQEEPMDVKDGEEQGCKD